MSNRPVPKYGSDFIVDLLKALGVEYAAFNPGSTFRGIHDSLVNYGGNSGPEIIECNHEEIAVAIAHGYAKAAGKPMVAMVHDLVGLQHATMAIYNAWCDRAPVIVMGGTTRDAAKRRAWIDWIHTALSPGNLVRDYVKWDDEPASIEAVPDAMLRAWKIALTEPAGPVYLCLDAQIQENELPQPLPVPDIRLYTSPSKAYADPALLEQLAGWLLESSSPVILADRAVKNRKDMAALTKLAEELAIPVVDKGSALNFPGNHPLDLSGAASEVIAGADLILAFEVGDLAGALQKVDIRKRTSTSVLKKGARVIHISMGDYLTRGWASDYQKLAPLDMAISASAGVALSHLASLCGKVLKKAGPTKQREVEKRRQFWGERHDSLREEWKEEAAKQAQCQPIHLGSLAAAAWDVIKKEDWVLVNGNFGGWARRIWDFTEPGQYLGQSGGAGLGYGMPASVGAALAHRGSGKLCVDLQADGDFFFCPQALWTAAHHQIPLLVIMNNNRSYLNSENHALSMARERSRPSESRWIGTTIEKPFVDFTGLARSLGIHAEGPIEKLSDLKPALKRAIKAIKDGNQPALVDVITAKTGRLRDSD